ncbi:hypothetical protein MHLP_03920 [Candidatus Mycoplasma haematolamae str. Purdue]|uniref:Lipoprotein n=1 Tax=Mycoplasma haematolamae (strain Purdue) TaxID=1212765 RepID=I7CKD8_MYCHA|nr:hypothetical protein [Candidatus Mycoplasma haematolamae]AFO52364.1 hypothetical protein MHLP_03920 [Candidatus Mycoplasma haematolamae str. Purdue]
MGIARTALAVLATGGGGSCLILHRVGYFGSGQLPSTSVPLSSNIPATSGLDRSLIDLNTQAASAGSNLNEGVSSSQESLDGTPSASNLVAQDDSSATISDDGSSKNDESVHDQPRVGADVASAPPTPVVKPGPVDSVAGKGATFLVNVNGEPTITLECPEHSSEHLFLDLEGERSTRSEGRYTQWKLKCGYYPNLGFEGKLRVDSFNGKNSRQESFQCAMEGTLETENLNERTFKYTCTGGDPVLKGKLTKFTDGEELSYILLESKD